MDEVMVGTAITAARSQAHVQCKPVHTVRPRALIVCFAWARSRGLANDSCIRVCVHLVTAGWDQPALLAACCGARLLAPAAIPRPSPDAPIVLGSAGWQAGMRLQRLRLLNQIKAQKGSVASSCPCRHAICPPVYTRLYTPARRQPCGLCRLEQSRPDVLGWSGYHKVRRRWAIGAWRPWRRLLWGVCVTRVRGCGQR